MSCYPGLIPAIGIQPWARAWNPARWWSQGQISDSDYSPQSGRGFSRPPINPDLGYTSADIHREVYGTDMHPMDPGHPRWKVLDAQYPDTRTVYPSRNVVRNPHQTYAGPWNYPTNHYGVPAMSFPSQQGVSVGKRKLSFLDKLFKRKNPVMTVVRGRVSNPSFWKGTQPGSPLNEAATANVDGDGYGSQTRPWVVWDQYWGSQGLQWQAPYAGYEYPTRQPGTWPPDYAPGVVATPTTNEWDMWLMYNPQLMENFAQWYGPTNPLFTNQNLAVRAWNHRRAKSWKPWKRNPHRSMISSSIPSQSGQQDVLSFAAAHQVAVNRCT